jgi:hypothetical protein
MHFPLYFQYRLSRPARCGGGGEQREETTMEWMTRFALVLFVRMIARAEQAMLLAGSARKELSAVRSPVRTQASRDATR